MKIENGNRLISLIIGVSLSVIAFCSSSIFLDINDDAFARTIDNRNSFLINDRESPNILMLGDGSNRREAAITLFHRISFADDTLFPQRFESTSASTNDITLSDGMTLPARPTTLVVNKIQSNNTLVITLHSLNDKYMLTGTLKGSSKPSVNSTADNAQFSLTGNVSINKNKSYSVVATLAETKGKQITLTMGDAKTLTNFKATIDFSPPRGSEPLPGI